MFFHSSLLMIQVVCGFPADGSLPGELFSDDEAMVDDEAEAVIDDEAETVPFFSGLFAELFSSFSVFVFLRTKTCGTSCNAEGSSAIQWYVRLSAGFPCRSIHRH